MKRLAQFPEHDKYLKICLQKHTIVNCITKLVLVTEVITEIGLQKRKLVKPPKF